MIITCTHCTMRLQVDDGKVPARAFTLRCPKCQNIIHAHPPVETIEENALAVGHSPASEQPRMEAPAPAYQPDAPAERSAPQAEKESASSTTENKELLRMLATLLQRGAQGVDSSPHGGRFKWERHVLVCVGESDRQAVADALSESEYQVFVARDKTQAVERMRDEPVEVLILAADFDPAEQGAAFMTREINSLRLAERRRLFLVQLSHTARTSDAHAAFINNVNLIVNREDLEKLGRSLERSLRDFNELYRCFNEALKVSPI